MPTTIRSIGCTFQDDPFVFYNVISGNGGNGLRVTNSNHTTIQANFFGLGADNDVAVGNALDGVLVEGSSAYTVMGGPIPLGNVDSANGTNGIEVRGTASFFTTYNTFCGLAAFSDNPTFGNGQDGMLITSTGGNILIRTNVITRNGANGIEISGSATGVRVAGNIIGLNTDGLIPMGNLGDGVKVGGNANNIVIGGPQPTFNVVPLNIISSNGGDGVAIVGTAHNILVSNGYIGTDVTGKAARGNAEAGVYLGSGTYSNTIGASDPTLLTVISGNTGDGIQMCNTRNNTVIGTYIGLDSTGSTTMDNGGNGIEIKNSSNNVIGRTLSVVASQSSVVTANRIADNDENGVLVNSGTGNSILGNSIFSNGLLGIDLASGANNNQAAPVLTSVTALAQGIQISGTVVSRPNSVVTIEFFANAANEPSGQVLLGTVKAITNRAGVAQFTFHGQIPLGGGRYFTATATDPSGNTSEFSAVAQVSSPPSPFSQHGFAGPSSQFPAIATVLSDLAKLRTFFSIR